MDAARWEQLQALFHEAAELREEEREEYLRARSGHDPTLVPEVLAMLAADAEHGSILDEDLGHIALEVLDSSVSGPQMIGPYRVLRLLGKGGMGYVYLAERSELGHQVAIKVLRDATLSPARRRRFMREQTTLAQLKHPGIASLYDADVASDGTPYIVMEYVDGVPITRYAAELGLSVTERLRLFRSALEAVQYAHRQAIVHRDLKPSNILVKKDEDGSSKVVLLDFGISKSLHPPAIGESLTQTGLQLMTPAYAAPEQLRGEPLGLYTDVYSLGVVLYELLTERHPFLQEEMTAGRLEAAVLEGEAARPSQVVRAHEKRTNGRGRWSAVKEEWSDLDVMCLTAIHRDPQRRYETVERFIRDIDHYLAGEPLEAQPDSLRYRMRKFLRRNRNSVTAAGIVFAVLAGLILYYTGRLAEESTRARAEATAARQISEYLIGLFQAGDPFMTNADTVDVRTLLQRGIERAEALSEQPLVQAQMFTVLGRVYTLLSDYDQAGALLRRSLEIRRRENADALGVAESLANLGAYLSDAGIYDSAEVYMREALEIRRRQLPPHDPLLATTLDMFGVVLNRRGAYTEAESMYRDALAIRREIHQEPHIEVATTLNNLAVNLFDQGHYVESEQLFREALEMDDVILGPDNPSMAIDLSNFGLFLGTMGKYEEAESALTRALGIKRRHLGNDHYETAMSLTQLGGVLRRKGDLQRAEEYLREALAIEARVLGDRHRNSAVTLNHLASTLQDQGRFVEARQHFERSISLFTENLGDTHPYTAITQCQLAYLMHVSGSPDAGPLFVRCLEILEETLPPGHDLLALHYGTYAEYLMAGERYDEAEPLLQKSYDVLVDRFGADHPDTRKAATRIDDLNRVWQRSRATALTSPGG